MNLKIALTAATIALGFPGLGELSFVQTTVAADTATLSAATKKNPAASRQREPSQVACTELGCHPIPPGCRSQMGYNWDGIPTGFDICRLSVPASPLKAGVNFRRFRG
jgi:hypothetical protein